ncbi:hypothetical protein AB6D11_00385 [Vibrio splendidus]
MDYRTMIKLITSATIFFTLLTGCTSTPDIPLEGTVMVVQPELSNIEAQKLTRNSVFSATKKVDDLYYYSQSTNGKKYRRYIQASKVSNQNVEYGAVINYDLPHKYYFNFDVQYYYSPTTRTIERKAIDTERYRHLKRNFPDMFLKLIKNFDEEVAKSLSRDFQKYIDDRDTLLSGEYTLSAELRSLMSDSDMKEFNELFTQSNVDNRFLDYFDYNFKGYSLVDDYVDYAVSRIAKKGHSVVKLNIDNNKQISFTSVDLFAMPTNWSINDDRLKITVSPREYRLENLTDKFITIDRTASYVNTKVSNDEMELPLELPPKSTIKVRAQSKIDHYYVYSDNTDQSVKFALSIEYSIESKKHTLNGSKSFKPLID